MRPALREAAVAFHLLSIEYYASIIETSGDAEDLGMLGDMLVQHMMGVRALIAEAAVNLDVVLPQAHCPRQAVTQTSQDSRGMR